MNHQTWGWSQGLLTRLLEPSGGRVVGYFIMEKTRLDTTDPIAQSQQVEPPDVMFLSTRCKTKMQSHSGSTRVKSTAPESNQASMCNCTFRGNIGEIGTFKQQWGEISSEIQNVGNTTGQKTPLSTQKKKGNCYRFKETKDLSIKCTMWLLFRF